MPITWRDVIGQSLADAARPLEYARQSIGDGFSAFQRVIDSRNAGQAEMAKQTQDTNTANYQDLVATIKRPEDAAAMAPQLADARAILSPAARIATRGAVDDRTGAVMKQITDRLQFAHAEQDEREHPIVQDYRARIANGDTAGAAALLAQNPQLRNIGDVATAGAATTQANDKFKSDQLTAQVQRQTALENAAATQLNAITNGQQVTGAHVDRINTQLTNSIAKMGEVTKSTLGGAFGDIVERNLKNADPGLKQKTQTAMDEAFRRNPQFRDIPADVAEAAIGAAAGKVGSWYNPFLWGDASSIEANLNAVLASKPVQERMLAIKANREKLQESIQRQTLMRDIATAQAIDPVRPATISPAAYTVPGSSNGGGSGTPAPAGPGNGLFANAPVTGAAAEPAARPGFQFASTAAEKDIPAILQREYEKTQASLTTATDEEQANRARNDLLAIQQEAKRQKVTLTDAAPAPAPAQPAAAAVPATPVVDTASLRSPPVDRANMTPAQRQVADNEAYFARRAAEAAAKAGPPKPPLEPQINTALSSGDVKTLSRLQGEPEFALVDRSLKVAVYKAIENGGIGAGAKKAR